MTNLILTYHVKLYSTVCIIHYSLVKPISLTLLIEFKVLWSDASETDSVGK